MQKKKVNKFKLIKNVSKIIKTKKLINFFYFFYFYYNKNKHIQKNAITNILNRLIQVFETILKIKLLI